MSVRIIPRLDIKGPNLVKGIQLEGLRVLGNPSDFAEFYYQNGADEILYMDVVASLYERNSLNKLIEETAKKVFIPITVGGGLRKLEDINKVLCAGADKVVINTAAVKNPSFVSEAVREFGSSTIVIAIEAIKQSNGNYLAYTDNGREFTNLNVEEWVTRVVDNGAGEIVITSVDKEGTAEGFDIELTSRISEKISVPIVAHGGAGNSEHVRHLIKNCNVDAVSISSLFHYDVIQKGSHTFHDQTEGNTDFLNNRRINKRLKPISIIDLKKTLIENSIDVRL